MVWEIAHQNSVEVKLENSEYPHNITIWIVEQSRLKDLAGYARCLR